MRNFARILAIAGPIITIQSILWEYARMHPAYRFIVEPWALRGLDMTQGRVFASIGAAALVVGLLAMRDSAQNQRVGMAITAVMVALGVVITAIFAPSSGYELKTMATTGLALVYGFGGMKLARRFLPNVKLLQGVMGGLVVTLGFALLDFLIIRALFGGSAQSPAIIAALVFVGLGLVAVAGTPVELAANRAFIFATVVGGLVIARIGPSLRAALVSAQMEMGAAAQYKDTQTTNGWMIACLGMFLAFVGAVGLWARRRDYIASQRRAAQQREAAEKSAAEIAAAAEARAAEARQSS
ncbi:MAG: hypothetical protein HKN07_05555 [Acidimicrobiia bacterium]|nr:hypothetical protein [Acidimicrobiia bacterium]